MQISQVPAHIEDREHECVEHTKEVIRRQVHRRQKKRLSRLLTSTLDGDVWDPTTKNIKYKLFCPVPSCANKLYEMSFWKSDEDDHGVFCCAACRPLLAKLIKITNLRGIGYWEKLTMDKYCIYDPEEWDVSIKRTKTLLTHVTKITKHTVGRKRKQRETDTMNTENSLPALVPMSLPAISSTKRKKMSTTNLVKHVVDHLQEVRTAVRLFDQHLERLTDWLEDSDE